MRKDLSYLCLLLLLFVFGMTVSCSPKVTETVRTEIKDSIIVQVHERIVKDTVTVEIPYEVEKIVTRDTLSELENTFAKSVAKVSDGFLFHTLESIPQSISKPVQVQVKDSVKYKYSSFTHQVTGIQKIIIPRELTFIQKAQMWGFWILLALLGILYWKPIFSFVKKFWPLIRKLFLP